MKYGDRSIAFSIGLLIIGATLVGLFNGEDLNPVLGSVPCGITGSNNLYHEGANDLELFLPATGTIHGVMLFVDFFDKENNQSTHELFEKTADAPALAEKLSYGKMSLKTTPIHTWYQMPKPTTDYNFGIGFEAFISEAIQLADDAVDFGQYDFVAIVYADEEMEGVSTVFNRLKGEGILIDETEIRHAVVLNSGMIPLHKEILLIHEFGHLLGLPDLYMRTLDQQYYVGNWDVMGIGNGLFAWHRYKLGWLAENQVACVSDGQQEYRLTELNETGGLKAVVAPITSPDGNVTGAIVAEVRTKVDTDSEERKVCAKGVLVYEVWTTVESGMGPVRVKGPKTSAGSCDESSDYVPLQVGQSRTDHGVAIEVLSKFGNTYRVRVSR